MKDRNIFGRCLFHGPGLLVLVGLNPPKFMNGPSSIAASILLCYIAEFCHNGLLPIYPVVVLVRSLVYKHYRNSLSLVE